VKRLLGLLLTCGVVPAIYAGGMYYLVTNHALAKWGQDDGIRAAWLIALPLVVSGAVKWWDVWVMPGPKLGGYWSAVPPSVYAVRVFRGHAIVAVVCVVVQLLSEQYHEAYPLPAFDVAKAEDELRDLQEFKFDRIKSDDDWKRQSELKRQLEEYERAENSDISLAASPRIILIASAAWTCVLIPRRYRNQSGHPITDDEG
jgi:hypothetical protein